MPKKEHKVILARQADKMLLLHTEFLARVSTIAARKLLADFQKAMCLLANNPFQFPFADEIDVPGILPETYRKCLFSERYKALYLVENNKVYIDVIIDCRQENIGLF